VLSCRIRWLFRFFPAGSCGIQWPESSTRVHISSTGLFG
jgi:hypothetical protein